MSGDMKHKYTRAKALQVREIIERSSGCGCGTGAYWRCIFELLKEAENHTGKGFYRDDWFEFGAMVIDNFKLIEHGSGIGFSWLTDDGKMLLEFLRDFGLEDHDFNTGEGWPLWSQEYGWDNTVDDSDSYAMWAKLSKPEAQL